MNSTLILITLLVKLGVAAAVSAALARSRTFQNLIFGQRRGSSQTLGLLAFICIPLALGVWMRFTVPNFQAADIAFETTVILGVLLGPLAALAGGAFLALPALLHHEYLALPFNLAVALIAGVFGKFVEEEEVWSFSPFVDLSIYRWVRRNLRKPRFDRQVLLMILIVSMEITREWLHHLYPRLLFALITHSWPIRFAIWACAPIVVGIPLKVWNAIRTERSLEEQKRLLLEARLDALQRQINPHFLFNTLNSIASLVRFRPEQARELIVKLANILRALLKDHDSYILLRDELSFTDDYLGIEVVRFGADKLKVVKEIDPRTLEIPVPSMLLQPLVENSIKHGLEPRIGGGTITLRSRIEGAQVIIEVEDDGVGIAPGRSHSSGVLRGTGIGMKNVRERLEVLYGQAALFDVTSRPGRGTKVTLAMPLRHRNGDAYGADDQETLAPSRSTTRS
ncbi:two-component system LytT family sensor kinase [Silvibacterium bohemicum]|uniref:histidine kinase n=1 Tax=Silvibacterium bohemicum TaxID=1577686 RepID=A0A841JXM5_9BACT|nr:histidine kinase [Silvibacterium bohemicum]MBB6145177.1 two-component system LytT family sensor kinase [Silvibacterium bohemicum]